MPYCPNWPGQERVEALAWLGTGSGETRVYSCQRATSRGCV